MSWKFFAAIFAIAVLPFAAQAQQGGRTPPGGPKPTTADVQRVVKIIVADKAKTQTYCDLAKLDEQIAQAEQSKDEKKAEELSKKADEMANKLGPEYLALMDRLEQVDPSSKEGQQLVAAFEPLDKQCAR
jgi:hypothetical protein